MKLSVITVVRNCADTIAETLGTVAEQSHRDLEHIVIDGASTDATLEIVARHAGPSVRIVSEPDHGIYDAMNKGVRLSTGQVIGFLNADDVYAHPRVIADVVAAMQRDDVDAVFGDAGFFRADRPSQPVRRYNSARFSPKRIAWGWM